MDATVQKPELTRKLTFENSVIEKKLPDWFVEMLTVFYRWMVE